MSPLTGGQRSSARPNSDCRLLMRRQFGLITRAQAIARGETPRTIEGKLGRGEWRRIHSGIYAAEDVAPSWEQGAMLGSLVCGDGGALSHRAAGAIYSLDECNRGDIEIWTPRRLSSPPVVVHFGALEPRDVACVGSFKVTTPTRTLIDLASVLDEEALEICVECAMRKQLCSSARLLRRLSELGTSGRHGAGTLRHILEAHTDSPAAESPLEVKTIRLIRSTKLPPPIRQFVIADGRWRLDLAYPKARVAIECHSYRWHYGRREWRRDAEKRAWLERNGWVVIYLTWDDVTKRPQEAVRRIETALGSTLF